VTNSLDFNHNAVCCIEYHIERHMKVQLSIIMLT